MQNFFLILLYIIAFSFLVNCGEKEEPAAASSSALVDDLGKEINLTEPPERIITLSPNLTEQVY